MILSADGFVRIEGSGLEVLAETACILHAVYEKLIEKMGKEWADEQMVKLGRIAVMSSDELENAVMEMMK